MAYRVQYQIFVEPVLVPATAAAPSVASWAPQSADPARRPFAVALIVAGTVLPVFTGPEAVSADRWRGNYPDVPPPARRVVLTGQTVLPVFTGPETVTVDRWLGSYPALIPAPRRLADTPATFAPVFTPVAAVIPTGWLAQQPDPVRLRPPPVQGGAVAPVTVPVATVTPTGWLAQFPGPLAARRTTQPGGAVAPVFVPTPFDWRSQHPTPARRAFPAHLLAQGLSAPVYVPPAVLPPLGWLVQLPDLVARARGVTPGGASFVYAPTATRSTLGFAIFRAASGPVCLISQQS